MKKLTFLFFGLSVLFSFLLNSNSSALITAQNTESNGTIIKEQYIRKELFSLNWGKGENELGKRFQSECSCGPEKIIVNNNGEIFIYDFFKGRILILTPEGKNISKKFNSQIIKNFPRNTVDFTFDKANNLYILTRYGEIHVLSYKDNLKQNKVIRLNKKIEKIYNYQIKVDNNNSIILLGDFIYLLDQKTLKELTSPEYKNIIRDNLILKYYNWNGEREENISYPKMITCHSNKKEVPITTPSLRKIKLNLHYKEKEGLGFVIKGEDKYGSIYLFLSTFYIYKPGPDKEILQKYNKDGNWITNIEIDKDDSDLYLFLIDNKPIIYVDEEGNIYHLWIKEKVVKVIKWELVK